MGNDATPLPRPARRLPRGTTKLANGAHRCRKKFLHFFPGGYRDPGYFDWERGYKWQAHQQWEAWLGREAFAEHLAEGRYADLAARAVTIEARTNLLFSFEKIALRDAVRSPGGARQFATALFEFLHGDGGDEERFVRWCESVTMLPRQGTRVLTWPLLTVFGFIAQPDRHIFLKPRVTQAAAQEYGFDLRYASRPEWDTYASLLAFAERVRRDTRDLRPRDMIDLQSFIWVQGSDEYDE